MSLTERLHRAREQRKARTVGFEAAVGIPADEADDADAAPDAGPTCHVCGIPGRIDLVDVASARAYLTCTTCSRSWETSDLASVLRR